MKPLWMKKLVKSIFGMSLKGKNKPYISKSLEIESLEIRLTPTVVSNDCGTLFVTGTTGVDNTFIWLDGTDLKIAEPSFGSSLRSDNVFNSANSGVSRAVIGANGVSYDLLNINLANQDAAEIFDNLTVNMGDGNDVLSIGFDPINGFATTGLDFTTLATTLTSSSVIVNFNGDSSTQTFPTLSGINTFNAGGIVSSYNSDLNIINFDTINNGDVSNSLLTLRASQGSLLISDPNLFFNSDGSINSSLSGTITLNNRYIDPVLINNGGSKIAIEASGNGNRIIINNPINNNSGELFLRSQTNLAGGLDDILIKSIANNSSINPLDISITTSGLTALTVQTLGDVYFEGSLDVNGLNVLEAKNFTANGNVTSSYNIEINSQTGNNTSVFAFNKNVVTDYDFNIYNLGSASSSGAQFYINKDALDLGTTGLIFSVQCNFNAYNGATAIASVGGGAVSSITVTNPGFGYLQIPALPPTVTLSGGGGSGATATAVIDNNGQITSITKTTSGIDYTSSPTVTIAGSGGIYDLSILGQTTSIGENVNINNLGALTLGTVSNTEYASATGLAVLGSGVVNSITTDNVVGSVTESVTGAGYTSAPLVTITGGGGGSGAAATAILNANGTISYTVTSQGSGYTSRPNVILSGGGFSTIAQAVANLRSLVGSNYTSAPLVSFIGGGGSGATATAVLGSGATAGQVVTYLISNPGIGYTSAPTVILTRAPGDTTGSGASAIAKITTINADTVTRIIPILVGGGYTSAPSVIIAGVNSNAIAVPVLGTTPGTLGQVTNINNIDGGSGYSIAPLVTISAPTTPGGVQAVFTANINNGIVTGFTPVTAGSGYTSTPTITITRIAGATATAVLGTGLNADKVTSLIPILTGTNYTSAPLVSFIGGGGSGADYIAVLGTGAQQGKVVNYILNPFNPNAAGSGYTSAPTVIVTLAQITASATAVLSGGAITSLTPLNNGLGYTSPPMVTISGGGGTGADYIAVLGLGAQQGQVVNYIPNPLNPNAAGSGYTSIPTVTVVDPGTASATAILGSGTTAGQVVDYTITDVGFGYTSVPAVTVAPSPAVKNASLTAGGFFNALNLSTDAATIAATPFNLFSDITVQFDISTNRNIFVKPAATTVPVGSENRTFTMQSRSVDITLAGNITLEDYNLITAKANAVLGVGPSVAGTVVNITPIIPGSGYTSAPLVTITGGGGTGATATAVLGTGAQKGQVISYTITNPGVGYISAPTILVAPIQVDATASSIAAGGSIISINPTLLGSGYTSAPLVTITGGGGSGAIATAVLGTGAQSGQVVSYTITNSGSGYTSPPRVAVASSTSIYGSNLTLWSGIATPSFRTKAVAGVPTILNGQVLAIPLTTQGVGYTSNPVVNIVGGGGSGATAIANLIPASSSATVAAPGTTARATATVNNPGVAGGGQVFSINVDELGSNYSLLGRFAPTVTISDPGITAKAIATLNATGGVGAVNLALPGNGGTNYTSNVASIYYPTVAFTGGGFTTIAQATATVNPLTGVITRINVTDPGAGYTSAPTVTISDPGITAKADPIVVGGQIIGYTITNSGAGYGAYGSPVPTVTISDVGITATASVTVGTGASAGTITSVSVVSRGDNYSQPPLVTIAPPPNGGVQATATAVIRNGRVRSFILTNPGSGYDSIIPNITITNPGSGYTSLPTITLSAPEGDILVQSVTGPNRTFTINDAKTFNANSTIQVKNLVLEALNDPNTFSVGEYTFNNNIGLTNNPAAITAMAGLYNIQFLGSAYFFGGGSSQDLFNNSGQILLGNNSTDTFDFTSGVTFGPNTTVAGIATITGNSTIQGNLTPGQVFGTGLPSATAILSTGAQAIATVSGGGVSALVGVVTGYGYTSAPMVTILGGGGLGATATAVLGSGTTAGQVVRYVITNPGIGYTSTPTVTLNAPSGTGQLSAILPTNFGSGYTIAPAVVISGGGGTGATATAVLGVGTRVGQVVDYIITNAGSGYTSAPTISFASVGILTFINPLILDNASNNSTYSPVIIGNRAGVNQSQVVAKSGYTLTATPVLLPSLGSLTATPGTAFTILSAISSGSSGKFSGLTDPVTNTYSTLNEGDIFYAGNATYKISYTGGTGSSVVITFVRNTTGGNNFTANIYYNSGVAEVLVTSTGIDVDATILSIFNTSANTITFDAGAGNTIQFTDATAGNLNVSSGNAQTATIGFNNNIILGLKLLGNVGQDKFIIQDLNSKVLLNTAASFGVEVDTSSYSGGEYQDTLTIDGTVKVFGTGNFKTSNNNPVQNLDEIIVTGSGVIQSVGSGDILLVANHGSTSSISISSPPVSAISSIVLTASANAVLGTGTVSSLTPAIVGSGYTSAPLVTITGGGGSGAIFTANIVAGKVTSYTQVSGGTGYTSAPTVTVAPPTSLSSFSLELTPSDTTTLNPSGSVTLIAGLNIRMGGNVVRTNGGAISFVSAVNLTKDTYLTTGNIKADVNFASTIDETFDLTVNSFGSLNFQGNVGSNAPLGDITTQSLTGLNIIGSLNGISVPVSVNAASFNTAGGVNGNIVFSGTQNYTSTTGLNLASIKRITTATDSGAAGDITFNGAITLISGAILNLAHEGALNINANITNGLFTELSSSSSAVVNFGGLNPVTILSDAGITFNSPVNLSIDTNLQSTNGFGVTFNNTLNGSNDLAINTTGPLLFSGAVGATIPISSITTKFLGTNSNSINNPLQLDVNNSLAVGSFEAMVNGDIYMIQDQVYTGTGLTLVTTSSASTIRLGKIIGNVSSAADVSISNAGALILNDDIILGGNFTQGALFTGITLTNSGSNYTSVPSVNITGGGGSGATATASLGINSFNTQAGANATINAAGSISQIIGSFSGSGYSSPPTVTISAPSGNTATATSTVLGGKVSLFPVLPGSGYNSQSPPTITISAAPVGGTQATATAIIGTGTQLGQVIGYIITDAGAGYIFPPTVTVSPPPTTAATAIAVLGSGLTTGQVVGYIITYAGTGYTSPPSISVSTPLNFAIVNPGLGYVVGDLVTLVGSGGTPANAQITNVNATGGITGFTLLSPGNYTSGSLLGLAVISSTSSGSGGTVNASGFVESVSLTSSGSGYTTAPTISFNGGNGVGATAIANLTSSMGQVYVGNLGNPSTITIKTGIDSDTTFTSKTYLNQKLLLDGSNSTKSDVTFGAIEGGTLSLLPDLTIVAGGNLTFNGSVGLANPLGAIDASSNVLSSVQSTSTCLGINSASLKFSATGLVNLTAPQHYTGTTLQDGSVFGLDLTNTTSSGLVTLGDITTREYFNTQVATVDIGTPGNGFTSSPNITFVGGGGTGATASAFLGIDQGSAVILSSGSGYTLNQIVQIVQLGLNNEIIGSAIGQVTGLDVINNGIISLSILSPGYGFTDLNSLSVISSGFGGFGAGAVISATGFISEVRIISGGTGYTTSPVFSSGTADGIGLLAKKSNSVTVNNAGPVIFQGDINTRGNFSQIGQGSVTIGTTNSGTINLNSAGGDIFFNTSLVQVQNFVIDSSISTANSGNITFNGSIDSVGFKAITLTSGVLSTLYQSGNILIKGNLGISPMGNIQINNPNNFSVLGNVVGNSLVVNSAKGAVNFSGAVTLRGTIPVGTSTVSLSIQTILPASSIVFQNPVITVGNVIIKNTGTFVTTSIADMSIQGSFQQNGTGISSISGDISTTVGGISFGGPVSLSGTPKFIAKNTVSTSSLVDITFQNDVNGLGGISLDTTGRVLFLGNVGLLSPLSSIEIINANYTNPLDLVAVQFNSSASQVTNANKIILPEPTSSSNINGRVIFNGTTNISNAFTTTRSYYDIFFNSNVTFSTNTNFLNGGKVKFSGTTNFTGSASFNNSGTLEASGIIVSAGSLIVQRPLAITNNLQLYLSSSNNSFTSSVSGNSIVTMNSGGTLVLTGNSPQFTGNFVVNTNTINGVNRPSTLQVNAFYNNATVTLNGGTFNGTGRVLNVLSAINSTAIAVLGTGLNAGKVRSINVTTAGSGYISPPTVTISAPAAGGTRATATVLLGTGAFAGQIIGFTIINPGSGYTFIPSVSVSLPTAGGTFSPGAVLGNLTVGNQLVLGANNTFLTSINGVSPGTFGQATIISGGAFNINNANLSIVLNTNLTAGNQIPLVNLGGGSSSLGNFTFNGVSLTQGSSFSISSNGYTNTFTISYTGGDGNDIVLTVSGSTASSPPPGSFTASQVVGVDYGGGSVVQIQYTNGSNLSFFAYSPLYTGGVRVALGDVNGDGIDELITGTGVGGGPHIKVFNLQGGQPVEIASFFAFEPTFMGGVNISTGDINGDGLADIIIGAGAGGGPRVKVFSGAANYFINAARPLMDFFAYDPAFTGGVTVAAGNRDGYKGDEVITGAGFGGGPNIRSFNQFGQMVDNFFAFSPNMTSGIYIAAGYVDADAVADIIAGTGFGTPSQVQAFFSTGANPSAIPFVPGFVGGARVGVAMNSSGKQIFAAAAGPGGAPQVNLFNNSLDTTSAYIAIDSLFSGGLFLNSSIYAAGTSLPNR